MDLNQATECARAGFAVRADGLMREDWTVRWHAKDKLLYYFDPMGVRKHKIVFTDQHRASYQWRVVEDPPPATEPPSPETPKKE